MTVQEEFPEWTTVWLPAEDIQHRIAEFSLPRYAAVVRQAVARFFEESKQQRGFDIQVAFVLVPESVPLFDIQVRPWIDELARQGPIERLYVLESPPVWAGPILVTTILKIGTGCAWINSEFEPPFLKILTPLSHGERSDDFIRRLVAHEKSQRGRMGTRLRNWCWKQVETRWAP